MLKIHVHTVFPPHFKGFLGLLYMPARWCCHVQRSAYKTISQWTGCAFLLDGAVLMDTTDYSQLVEMQAKISLCVRLIISVGTRGCNFVHVTLAQPICCSVLKSRLLSSVPKCSFLHHLFSSKKERLCWVTCQLRQLFKSAWTPRKHDTALLSSVSAGQSW